MSANQILFYVILCYENIIGTWEMFTNYIPIIICFQFQLKINVKLSNI